jgi:hypothetical protein
VDLGQGIFLISIYEESEVLTVVVLGFTYNPLKDEWHFRETYCFRKAARLSMD